MTNVVPFRPRAAIDHPGPAVRAPAGRRPHPVASLTLILRGLPGDLQPAAVARELLGAGSREAALPLWDKRRSQFRKALAQRRISPARLLALFEEYRAAIRSEGIAFKARRREGLQKASRALERLADDPA